MTAALFSAPANTSAHIGEAGRHVAALLTEAVLDADRNADRTLQTALGPSQIGDPCAARIAHHLMGTPECNQTDPWMRIVGTAVHAWLEHALRRQNATGVVPIWLVEQTLSITASIPGHGDAYYAPGGYVIDHKVIGESSMKKYKKDGPGAKYTVQGHLYGYGYRHLGLPVSDIVLAFYPRSGYLDGLWCWSEPYDEQVALGALARLGDITELLFALELETHPDRWPLVPVNTSSCAFCPFYRPGRPADNTGCPGPTTSPPA